MWSNSDMTKAQRAAADVFLTALKALPKVGWPTSFRGGGSDSSLTGDRNREMLEKHQNRYLDIQNTWRTRPEEKMDR